MLERTTEFIRRQTRAPIHEALEQFRNLRVVPFDVPGHKRGRGNPELTAFLGQQCVSVDVNSMKPLDNLCHPISVIREAEILAKEKEAMDAKRRYFGKEGELFKKREALLKPIQDEIYAVIQEIAQEKRYDVVKDRSADPSLIYMSSKLDISDQVLHKLGAK